MKSIFEKMGGTYRQVGDSSSQTLSCRIPAIIKSANTGICAAAIGKSIIQSYNNYRLEGTLFKRLTEIDQACNERMEIIVSAMAKQEGVTEALKASDQME